MKKNSFFKYIIGFCALMVASCGAYFSVFGLSQLFSGSRTAVIILGSVLEGGKIIATTTLHRYWSKLMIGLRVYLTISVIVLMLITSVGIYGFLTNSFQQTANKLELNDGKTSLITSKMDIFNKKITDNDKLITNKNKRLEQLSSLREKQENRIDSAKTNRVKDKLRNDILLSNNEIHKLSDEIDLISKNNNVLNDSINKLNIDLLKNKNNDEISGEVGPLKYISELTGKPMSQIVNYLVLLLIFVFDPLAIALVLATNKIFEIEAGETKNISQEYLKVEDLDVKNTERIDNKSNEFDKKIEVKDDETKKEEVKIEKTNVVKKEPVITTGKISSVDDIKEKKENKANLISQTPQNLKSNNQIERIGSNKYVKDDNKNNVIFKRD